jgi:hypothetical protein
VFWLYTFHSRVHPNWIAPAVLPLFCLMVAYWDTRLRLGERLPKNALIAGVSIGLVMVVLAHETNYVKKLGGHPLPVHLDPLRRVRAWQSTALAVGEAREQLMAEGKPVFIIGGHYGITSQISFYLPEAKERIKHEPFVYARRTEVPVNQFYFWPDYSARKGQNAIYVYDLNTRNPKTKPPPPELARDFASVTDIGVREIYHGKRVFRRIHLFECRDLR